MGTGVARQERSAFTATRSTAGAFVGEPVEFEEVLSPITTSLESKVHLQRGGFQPIRAVASVDTPPSALPEARQRLLQTFVGEVVALNATEFVSILRDATDPTRPDERVEIAIDEVVEEDLGLLTVGSVFYWLFLDEVRNGTRRTVTDLRFRRLPTWSKSELADVKRRAADRARRFGIDSSQL